MPHQPLLDPHFWPCGDPWGCVGLAGACGANSRSLSSLAQVRRRRRPEKRRLEKEEEEEDE